MLLAFVIGAFFVDYFGIIFGVILVFLLIIIYILIIGGLESKKLKKLRNQLSYSKLNEVKDGLVKIKGVAVFIDPLKSEIKQKECIGYSYKVETFRYQRIGGVGKMKLKPIIDSYDFFCNPFLLKDETGEIKVSVDDIEILAMSKPKSIRKSNKRYTEEIFKNNTEVEIIGRFSKGVLMKDVGSDVFVVSRVKS